MELHFLVFTFCDPKLFCLLPRKISIQIIQWCLSAHNPQAFSLSLLRLILSEYLSLSF
jgi:hypothetical protein